MGYGEANQKKKVIVVEFNNKEPVIEEYLVPCFQVLERIVGSIDEIHERIEQLKDDNPLNQRAWLEIEYTGTDIISNLRDTLDESLNETSMEIRRIKNKRITDQVISTIHNDETLDNLNENDVFKRCLETFDVPLEEQDELILSYNEIIKSLHEEDVNAE